MEHVGIVRLIVCFCYLGGQRGAAEGEGRPLELAPEEEPTRPFLSCSAAAGAAKRRRGQRELARFAWGRGRGRERRPVVARSLTHCLVLDQFALRSCCALDVVSTVDEGARGKLCLANSKALDLSPHWR
jgi:hypothetical protein